MHFFNQNKVIYGMPRKKSPSHKVIHFEIPAKDPKKSMKFYSDALGWEFDKWDGPIPYWFTKCGPKSHPGIEGAIAQKESDDDIVVNTIDVQDIDTVIKKIEKSGGTITNPKHAIPGEGWIAYFKDIDGNMFGIMQLDPNAR
jgi:predicted enzyme related to lactoylglutathione lyase